MLCARQLFTFSILMSGIVFQDGVTKFTLFVILFIIPRNTFRQTWRFACPCHRQPMSEQIKGSRELGERDRPDSSGIRGKRFRSGLASPLVCYRTAKGIATSWQHSRIPIPTRFQAITGRAAQNFWHSSIRRNGLVYPWPYSLIHIWYLPISSSSCRLSYTRDAVFGHGCSGVNI